MEICANPRCVQPDVFQQRCRTCQSLTVNALVAGRYRIERALGKGGFSISYLVQDLDYFGEYCALKELHAHYSLQDIEELETATRLFQREAQILIKLDHPGIPKLYSYFQDKKYYYLLREYIPGENLAEQLAQRQTLYNETEARHLLYELADILVYLHNQNPPIIHRDIKPQNLLHHVDGRLLLIDFGAVSQATYATGRTFIGSPGYTPVEQIAGQPLPQSDLYAVGATVLRLMTGLQPHQIYDKKTRRLEWQRYLQVSNGLTTLLDALVAPHHHDRLDNAELLQQRLRALVAEPPLTQLLRHNWSLRDREANDHLTQLQIERHTDLI
jgi:serine/threonine protein kinase